MGLISKDVKKNTLYYNSESSVGKQSYAYILSSEKEILAIDIAKTNVPGSHWIEIAEKLNIQVADLIDRNHPEFIKSYGADYIDLEVHDWLKLLKNSPQVVTYPVAILGDTYIQVKNPSDLVKYIESDGQVTHD